MLYGGAGDDTFVLGLHEGGDQVFDHEGQNTLRLTGADPDQLSAVMQGDDLVLSHGDRVVATAADYAQHADNFVGIDLGHGVRGLDDFMAEPAARAMAQGAAGDWLADYLPAAGRGAAAGRALEHDGGRGPRRRRAARTPILSRTVVDEPFAIAGAGALEPLPDAGFAADPVAGGDDLWLPVDPTDGTAASTNRRPVAAMRSPTTSATTPADGTPPARGERAHRGRASAGRRVAARQIALDIPAWLDASPHYLPSQNAGHAIAGANPAAPWVTMRSGDGETVAAARNRGRGADR